MTDQHIAFWIVASAQGRVLKRLPAMGHRDPTPPYRTWGHATFDVDDIPGCDYIELRLMDYTVQVYEVGPHMLDTCTDFTSTFSFDFNYTPPQAPPAMGDEALPALPADVQAWLTGPKPKPSLQLVQQDCDQPPPGPTVSKEWVADAIRWARYLPAFPAGFPKKERRPLWTRILRTFGLR